MLCYRCGSYNSDGSKKCTVCSAALAAPRRPGKVAPTGRRGARGRLPVEAGTVWAGRYRVVDGIAHGAAGWVVRARDEEVDVDVALKLVAPNLLQADEERAKFLKLVRTAKKLHHPNVVRIYDEGEQGSSVFYTMPFLEGLTLRKIIDLRVERAQIFGFAEVLPIAAQLASALDGWQRVGVHGALRPHNIVVLPDVLKVTGLAHMRGLPARPFLALHQQHRTVDYIAPEVRREDRDLTASADVYSVAVMLGEMLVGRLQGTDPTGWVDAASRLPTGVVEVLRRGASETPADRYQSGAALFEALAAAMSAASPDLSVPGIPALPAFATELLDDVSEPSTMDDPVELVMLKDGATSPSGPGPQILEQLDTLVAAPESTPSARSTDETRAGPRAAKTVEEVRPTPKQAEPSRSEARLANARPEARVVLGRPRTPTPALPTPNDTDRITARPRDRHLRAKRARASSVVVVFVTLALAGGAIFLAKWYGAMQAAQAAQPSKPVPEVKQPETTLADIKSPEPALVTEPTPVVPAPARVAVGSALTTPTPVRKSERSEAPSTEDALRRIATLSAATETDAEPPPRTPLGAPPPPPLPPPPKPPSLVSPPPADEPSPPAVMNASCPPGMATVKAGKFTSGSDPNDPMRAFGDEIAPPADTGSYCVDLYEYPNQRGREPAIGYTWLRAKKACESGGKRLCSEDEWERACKGPSGAKFPFGNQFDSGICNVAEGGKPVPAGEYSRCRSGYGVVDMSGNVSE